MQIVFSGVAFETEIDSEISSIDRMKVLRNNWSHQGQFYGVRRGLNLADTIKLVQNDVIYRNIRYGIHGRAHAERVLLFSSLLASCIEAERGIILDRQALTIAALLHDCGRLTDGRDENHGLRSAVAASEFIERHSVACDSDKIKQIIMHHRPPEHYQEVAPIPLEALAMGDADKLDRFRFEFEDGPNRVYFELAELSTPLMDIAARINGHSWRSFNAYHG